jgi:hypothetical protein
MLEMDELNSLDLILFKLSDFDKRLNPILTRVISRK